MQHHAQIRGFTLIELLIVVAIVGILSAFSFSSYQNSIRKSNRADAQQLLLAIANREELYMMDALNYSNSFTSLNFTSDQWTCTSGTACINNFYTVTILLNAGPPPTYTITATPIASSSQASDGLLTLNSAGAKTLNGVSGW